MVILVVSSQKLPLLLILMKTINHHTSTARSSAPLSPAAPNPVCYCEEHEKHPKSAFLGALEHQQSSPAKPEHTNALPFVDQWLRHTGT